MIGRDNRLNNELTDFDKRLLVTFANNDLNRSKTATHLHMSNSNVTHHLDLIYFKTGVNPRSFYGLLYLLTRCFGEVNYD